MPRRLAALAVAACLVAGCASGGETLATSRATGSPATEVAPSPIASSETAAPVDATSTPGGTAAAASVGATSAPSVALSAPPRTPGAGEFANPVISRNFPDPHVIRADDAYYAYSTAGAGAHIRYARSPDLVEWEILGDALPALASWSGLTTIISGVPHVATWAPAVAAVGDRYVMYYTTPAVEIPRPDGLPSQCIGVATSEDPDGPFVDESEGPIVCQPDLGGSIDATHFADDDGTQYVVWKNDGNCCGIPTRFFIQELTADGLELVGEPTDMGVSNDVLWERLIIEAPTLLKHDGTYYLLYSANEWWTAAYAVGYATATDVLGPYVDAPENPILKTVPPAAGPGHQSVVEDDDGDLWLTYHAWDYTHISYERGGRRAMWIDELVLEGGQARVLGPDAGPQDIP